MKEQTRRSSISTRGRVTIPVEMRKKFGFKSGAQVNWTKHEGRLVLTVGETVAEKPGDAKSRRGKALSVYSLPRHGK